MTITNVTTQQARDGLLFANGAKWSGSTITYSIPGDGAVWQAGYGTGEPTDPQYSTFNATQAANFRAAIEIWDSYIAPSMTEVSDATPGQIRVAFTDVTAREGSGVAAYGNSPPVGSEAPVNGDVWVDETLVSTTFAQQTSGFELLLHELGHTLGLKHPFDSPMLPPDYEFKTYSLMSYSTEDYFYTWSGGGGSIFYSVTSTIAFTPMVLDILTIQSHYGADTATGAGNNTYAFTMAGLNGRQTIYDASGVDTIDLSALTRGSNVDLRPGAYSDIAYYNVEDQIDDLTAQFGAGFEAFIRDAMTDPNRPAYEWERNIGLSFSTVIENVIGSSSADNIIGNDAANVLNGGAGADQLFGGLGNDTFYVDNAGDKAFETAGQGNDRVLASTSFKLAANQSIETLATTSPSGTAAINLTGNNLGQTVIGNDGDNKLDGSGGADVLQGRGGNDTFYVDNAGDRVIEAANQGSDRVLASTSFSLEANQSIETLGTTAVSGTVAINLTGNNLAQTINGNNGANTLDGGGGADLLYGLRGNDTFYVDNAGDKAFEAADQGNDKVLASTSFKLAADQSIETLGTTSQSATVAINLTGNNLVQTLNGNNGDNKLDGAGGADLMYGRGGNDTFYVDNASDKVFEATGQGNDRVFASTNFQLAADQSIETLGTTSVSGTATISLTGNNLGQTINGNGGVNTLDGGGGNDVLIGGAGNDAFRFKTALSATLNVDVITDFSVVADTIQLSRSIFSAFASTGFLSAIAPGSFNIGAAATQTDDRVIYNNATGALIYDSNGGAGGGATQFAILSVGLAGGVNPISASDFQIIA